MCVLCVRAFWEGGKSGARHEDGAGDESDQDGGQVASTELYKRECDRGSIHVLYKHHIICLFM